MEKNQFLELSREIKAIKKAVCCTAGTTTAGVPVTYSYVNSIVTGNNTIPANVISFSLSVLNTTPVAWTFNGLVLNAADANQVRNFSTELPNGSITPINFNLSTNRALLVYTIKN